MNNDLISREYIKLFVCEYEKFNGKETEIVKAVPIQAIDNAPTVELTETEIQEVLNKRCMTVVANEYLIALQNNKSTAEWKTNRITGDIFCSRCKKVRRDTRSEHIYFCNHCGARMKTKSEVTHDNQL